MGKEPPEARGRERGAFPPPSRRSCAELGNGAASPPLASRPVAFGLSACACRPSAHCGIIHGMRSNAHTRERKTRGQSAPALQQNDVELAIKAIRGLADVAAGRCAPLEEVRARVLSRYSPAMAHA